MPETSAPSRNARLVGGLFAIILAVLIFGHGQLQTLADWWKLRGYTAPADIVQLANDTAMTSTARHLYYLNHPAVEDKSSFAKVCPSDGEKSIVLGCYKGGENGIYILSVTDKRLHGVEQVTAAHEMLHGAYERLGKSGKAHVDKLLQDYYRHGLRDQRIKDILKDYESSEPGQQLNEMHSIFGTEISKLPPELEDYYKQYFTDRGKIAAFAADYQAAFTDRQATVKKDDAQLAAWKKAINADESALETQQAELQRRQAQLNGYKTSHDASAYNAAVPGYNAKVDDFNTLLDETKSLIGQYNQLVKARNAIAVEATQLQDALSGSLSPISQ
jgi:hypothetical protein